MKHIYGTLYTQPYGNNEKGIIYATIEGREAKKKTAQEIQAK